MNAQRTTHYAQRTTPLGLAFALLFLAAPLTMRAQEAGKTDLTGKWTFSVVTDNGTGTPTVTFKQQGDTLTGHYSSQTIGEQDFTGTVKGPMFTFTLSLNAQGQAILMTYTGMIESADSVKGTADFGGFGGATFTGKRQP